MKRFAFNFVNQYSAFFYAAFWQRDLQRVRSLLVFSFVVHWVSESEGKEKIIEQL